MRRIIVLPILVLAALPLAAQKGPATAASKPIATFDTTAGKLVCELYPDKAPKTVANFVGLAQGTKPWRDPKSGKMMQGVPLYNGTKFHRVIPNFMIQGGDPLGNGMGGPGYTFEDEFDPSLKFDRPGRLAMANSGPNTNGSQFFITEVPTPWLDNHHTIFGQCDQQTVDLVARIARMPRDERPGSNRPANAVKINSITIAGMPGAPAKSKPRSAKQPVTKKP